MFLPLVLAGVLCWLLILLGCWLTLRYREARHASSRRTARVVSKCFQPAFLVAIPHSDGAVRSPATYSLAIEDPAGKLHLVLVSAATYERTPLYSAWELGDVSCHVVDSTLD